MKTALEKIVYTTVNHTGVLTNTLLITEMYGKKHKDVLRVVDRLLKNGAIVGRNVTPNFYTTKNNRTARMYELDRKAFMVLALSFTGKDADRFKGAFVDLFMKQEDELEYWRQERLLAKSSMRPMTDQALRIEALLVEEKSGKAKMFYPNLQLQVNKAATGRSTPRNAPEDYRSTFSEEELLMVDEIDHNIQQQIAYMFDRYEADNTYRPHVWKQPSSPTLGRLFSRAIQEFLHGIDEERKLHKRRSIA